MDAVSRSLDESKSLKLRMMGETPREHEKDSKIIRESVGFSGRVSTIEAMENHRIHRCGSAAPATRGHGPITTDCSPESVADSCVSFKKQHRSEHVYMHISVMNNRFEDNETRRFDFGVKIEWST
jgi:hypothetical protein